MGPAISAWPATAPIYPESLWAQGDKTLLGLKKLASLSCLLRSMPFSKRAYPGLRSVQRVLTLSVSSARGGGVNHEAAAYVMRLRAMQPQFHQLRLINFQHKQYGMALSVYNGIDGRLRRNSVNEALNERRIMTWQRDSKSFCR